MRGDILGYRHYVFSSHESQRMFLRTYGGADVVLETDRERISGTLDSKIYHSNGTFSLNCYDGTKREFPWDSIKSAHIYQGVGRRNSAPDLKQLTLFEDLSEVSTIGN